MGCKQSTFLKNKNDNHCTVKNDNGRFTFRTYIINHDVCGEKIPILYWSLDKHSFTYNIVNIYGEYMAIINWMHKTKGKLNFMIPLQKNINNEALYALQEYNKKYTNMHDKINNNPWIYSKRNKNLKENDANIYFQINFNLKKMENMYNYMNVVEI